MAASPAAANADADTVSSVTAANISTALAHVLTHTTGLVHGTELPPHPHRTPAVSGEPVTPRVA